MSEIYDVAIVGLGILGSSSFYQASKAGLKTIGIDQFTPGHSFGSSHGETRITRNAIGEGDFYTPLILRSNQIRQEIENCTSAKLFHNCGCLIIGKLDYDFIQQTITSSEKHDIPLEILSKQETEARFPQFSMEDGEISLFEKSAGYLLAEKSIECQLKLGQNFGGQVAANEKVLRIDYSKNPIKIYTKDNQFVAKKLVVTAGRWINELIPNKNIFKSITQKVFWIKAKNAQTMFSSEKFPVFIKAKKDEIDDIYGFPTLDGESIKIIMENFNQHKDNFENDIFEFQKLIPSLTDKIVKTSDCHYVVCPDSHFVVDYLPENQNIVIATGAGHGFKYSYAIGEMAIQMLEGYKNPILKHLSISRFENLDKV